MNVFSTYRVFAAHGICTSRNSTGEKDVSAHLSVDAFIRKHNVGFHAPPQRQSLSAAQQDVRYGPISPGQKRTTLARANRRLPGEELPLARVRRQP
jgi:hypothetical protein